MTHSSEPTSTPTLSTLTHLECSSTHTHRDADELHSVDPESGRPLLARYDLERAAKTLTFESLRRREASLWRYSEVLPVREARNRISLYEGFTPLLAAPRLGTAVGLDRLWVKDEGRNPTGTFKARGMALAVSKAKELGATRLAVPTAGNAGAALAAYAARAGLEAHVAMPKDAPVAAQAEVLAYGGQLALVEGLIHDAGALVAKGCREHGWWNVATLKEPYRLEGKKTMGYELWEHFAGDLPDIIVYPTGGGTGLIGMWKAFAELETMGKIGSARPRMISVQPAGCAPVVRAFERGKRRCEPWEGADTLAPGIRVPHVFADDLILEAIYDSEGAAIAVEDDEIVDAIARLAKDEGIDASPEGAATFAGLRHLLEDGKVERGEKVVLFSCGTGLKHPELRPATP